MAASNQDKITAVFNSTNPNVARVSANRTAGTTTLQADNLAGWPTVTKVHFSTYRLDTGNAVLTGSQRDWTGIVTGNAINNLVLRAGGADNGNFINDVIEMNPTASWGQDLYEGFTKEHDSLGNHTSITPNQVSTDTILEKTSGNGVAIDGLVIKDGKLNTADSVVTSNVTDGAITGNKAPTLWWEEIGRATASANVTSLNIPTIANKKYLKIVFVSIPTSPTSSIFVQFNGDSAANYNFRLSDNGGTDTTGQINGIPIDPGSNPGSGSVVIGEIEGINIGSLEKAFFGHSIDTFATGNNAPRRREIQAKWRGTNAITQVTVAFSTAQASGTEIIVLGHN